jgi:drug/metabolite transporter (DMT)-like permease
MTVHSTDPARGLLLLAAASAAGVHAGLAPEHLAEWPPLGTGFVLVAAALSATAVALALRPRDVRPPRLLALLLAATIAAYTATRLAALPPLDPTREALDPLGVATTALEGLALVLALHLGRQRLVNDTGGTR